MSGRNQRESDRESLTKKTYEQRVALLKEIGPRYGVKVYPHKEGRNKVDVQKSKFIRECPKHGKVTVVLAAFCVRGNFGCHKCIHDEQAESARKPVGLLSSATKWIDRSLYLAVSECGNYIKIGVTSSEVHARIRGINNAAPIRFRETYCVNLSGCKALIVEGFLKRSLRKYKQDTLGKFPGYTEVVDIRKANTSVQKILSLARTVEGRSGSDGSGDNVTFEPGEIDWKKLGKYRSKSEQVDERSEKEVSKMIAEANLLLGYMISALTIEIAATVSLTSFNRAKPSHSTVEVKFESELGTEVFTDTLSSIINSSYSRHRSGSLGYLYNQPTRQGK